MAHFLFTAMPVEGHSATQIPIMTELRRAGHDVVWLAGARYAERAAAAGLRHVPLDLSTDFSLYSDVFDVRPDLREKSGVALLKVVFREVFLGDAAHQVRELESVLETFPADVIVTSGPQFGPVVLAERSGIPLAAIGDGPYAAQSDATPPFGPGLRPWPGAIGRMRHRALNRMVRAWFGDVQDTWVAVRREHGLGAPDPWVFDALVAADLILQGTVPGFEYPRPFPPSVRFVGAHSAQPALGWEEPPWWGDLDDGRPVVHLTQGTVRADPTELILPAIDALAGEDVLVVVTAGPIDAEALGPLPTNVRVSPYVPYAELLRHASVFLTNGGYIGTNLALSHGVPIVQVGSTEEKSEIGARVAHLGVGHAFKRLPSGRRLRAAVRSCIDDDALRDHVRRLADDFDTHDASRESAELLIELAHRKSERLVRRIP